MEAFASHGQQGQPARKRAHAPPAPLPSLLARRPTSPYLSPRPSPGAHLLPRIALDSSSVAAPFPSRLLHRPRHRRCFARSVTALRRLAAAQHARSLPANQARSLPVAPPPNLPPTHRRRPQPSAPRSRRTLPQRRVPQSSRRWKHLVAAPPRSRALLFSCPLALEKARYPHPSVILCSALLVCALPCSSSRLLPPQKKANQRQPAASGKGAEAPGETERHPYGLGPPDTYITPSVCPACHRLQRNKKIPVHTHSLSPSLFEIDSLHAPLRAALCRLFPPPSPLQSEMPHSTCFSPPPPQIPDAKLLPSVVRPSALAVLPSQMDFPVSLNSSPPRSPIRPPRATSPSTKRFFVAARGHGRSKSASATMTVPPPSCFPALSPPPPASTTVRRRREYAPPLLRTASMPLVIPEGNVQLALTMTPPTPTTPPAAPRSSFLVGVPRSDSPTRIYASSLSPAGARNGYYPGSSLSPRAPSPPSFLVNESMYPPSASSSSPSTPTSIRSRSPSISSLETIPDSPDAEQEAVEAELREAMERKAAKLESEDEEDSTFSRRRRSVDFDRGLPRWGAADKRKRWSVCGGEKRGDLDLETIWEEALNSAEANHNSMMAHRGESSDDGEEEEEDDHEHSGDEEEE